MKPGECLPKGCCLRPVEVNTLGPMTGIGIVAEDVYRSTYRLPPIHREGAGSPDRVTAHHRGAGDAAGLYVGAFEGAVNGYIAYV